MTDHPSSPPGSDHCMTCGDVADEFEVVEVDPGRGLALCRAGDRRQTVETTLVGRVRPGEVLLVHAGAAIARAAR